MHRPRITAATLLALIVMVLPVAADQIFISPGGGARAAIVDAIDHATQTVDVFAYAVTSREITDALVRATRRGVIVRVLLDRLQSTQRSSKANDLKNGTTWAALAHTTGSMHAKTIVIDAKHVWIGSYNFTDAAEIKNVEHLVYLASPALAATLTQHFNGLVSTATTIPRERTATATLSPCPACTGNPRSTFSTRGPRRWSDLPAR
jgi:phosphatidylserine/phosphatidylglycerophosphate/cardiolipin synthase-like enzyme